MLRRSSLLNCEENIISNNFIEFNRKQIKLINIITKSALLSFIIIILCILGLKIYSIYFGIIYKKERKYIVFDMISLSFLGINLLINNIILYFYLSFNCKICYENDLLK